jgi:hypothetical protein
MQWILEGACLPPLYNCATKSVMMVAQTEKTLAAGLSRASISRFESIENPKALPSRVGEVRLLFRVCATTLVVHVF